MTSMVYFWTLSTAEMTRMIMSVTLAPRSLRFVKASWPGVSMNVIVWSFAVVMVNAPIV